MTRPAALAVLAVTVLLVNLPFGYWRQGTRRFSTAWFLAVHVPVPFVYLLRTRLGVGWSLATLPLLVGAYFGGQWIGARFRRRRDAALARPDGPDLA